MAFSPHTHYILYWMMWSAAQRPNLSTLEIQHFPQVLRWSGCLNQLNHTDVIQGGMLSLFLNCIHVKLSHFTLVQSVEIRVILGGLQPP